MIIWKKLVKLIPHFVTIKRKVIYEVMWTEDFLRRDHVGETRFDTRQIVIKTNQTPKETVHTYIHEVLHAVSHEYDAALTETQVLALEKALTMALIKDNIFKEKSK